MLRHRYKTQVNLTYTHTTNNAPHKRLAKKPITVALFRPEFQRLKLLKPFQLHLTDRVKLSKFLLMTCEVYTQTKDSVVQLTLLYYIFFLKKKDHFSYFC